MTRSLPRIGLMITIIILVTCVNVKAHQVLPGDTINYQASFRATDPPVGPVRPVAEFEPTSHVMVRYPLGIPVALVAHLSNATEVICLVSSTSQQNSATTSFSSGGVNMDKVTFMRVSTDSYWTRDYAPWFIIDGNDEFAVMDFVYNRPRPLDNQIPQYFANQEDYPYYAMPLQQTGGNYMTDGINIVAQTTLVYNENSSLGQTGVNNIMQQYMGAEVFYGIPDPNNTYIDHIDCWGKFLAPDKVLVRSVPTSHAQYNAIEQAANYFATRNCAWGYPWKVYRVNTPQNQPYSNSLIVNKKVFVPTMNSSHDAAALDVYRDALPGYEVIGVPGAYMTPWESTDALHCRTHEIPDREMLYISHQPLWGEQGLDEVFSINAQIKAYSGQPLYGDSLKVVYKVNRREWQAELLQELGNGDFTTMLGGFAPGDTIRYFIHAADQSGRSLDHPFTGAWDTHMFFITQDQIPPTISHEPPVDYIVSDAGHVTFNALVTDNTGVSEVYFSYYTESQPLFEIPMEDMGEGLYSFDYYPEFEAEDSFLYYQIIAYDIANPPNYTFYPDMYSWQSIPLKTVNNDDNTIPALSLDILSIHPNPFHSGKQGVKISYQAQPKGRITWSIFNIRGQLVASGEKMAEGDGIGHLSWDGNANNGKALPRGTYLLQVEQNGRVKTRKMSLLD